MEKQRSEVIPNGVKEKLHSVSTQPQNTLYLTVIIQITCPHTGTRTGSSQHHVRLFFLLQVQPINPAGTRENSILMWLTPAQPDSLSKIQLLLLELFTI